MSEQESALNPTEFDVSTEEAAALLGIGAPTLSRPPYDALRRLPRGRRVFFLRRDIEAFMVARLRAPATILDGQANP